MHKETTRKRSGYVMALPFAALILLLAPMANAATLAAVGDIANVSFNGIIDGSPQPGLTAAASLKVLSTGSTWSIGVNLSNTSSGDVTGSRISILGFATDPDVIASGSGANDVNGPFDTLALSETTPQPQFTNIEVCAKAGGSTNNCSGAGGDGVTKGNFGDFILTLAFGNSVPSLSLTDFFVRYQSINRVGLMDGASGIGVQTSAVPLPAAAWLFFLGLAGLLLRRESLNT